MRLAEGRYWLATGDADVLLWAKGVAVHAGADVEIRTSAAGALQLHGPFAGEVLSALTGLRELDGWMAPAGAGDIPVLVVRSGDNWCKPALAGGGYCIYLLDRARGGDLWDAVIAAGADHHLRPIGVSEQWRIESGIYSYGADMSLENNPFEVTGLEEFVENKQRDYIGKRHWSESGTPASAGSWSGSGLTARRCKRPVPAGGLCTRTASAAAR